MTKPIVFVIGATGNIGSATVQSLSSKYADRVEIRAGVRNPDKADKLKGLAAVTVVKAEMGAKDTLVATLRGVNALYIVTPPTENKAQLAMATAEAAKEAGVKFILVVSTTAETDSIFGRQFTEIEGKISALGVPYAFLRLPLFIENNFGFKDPIVGQSMIYCPVDPEKPFTPVAVANAGQASAVILADPSKHTNKTYILVSDRHTFNDLTAAFSASLGREIKYVRVPYDAAKKSFSGMGYSEWQVDGTMELYHLIDSGSPITNEADLSHFEQITGEKPLDIKTWVSQVVGAFQA